MSLGKSILVAIVMAISFAGCGEPKTVIPTGEFTEEQKAKIKAEDQKVADEESHGAKKR
jgi:hypothetical protein